MPDEVKPLPIRIRLPYASEAEFAAGYSGQLSRRGAFVVTETPKPVGSWLAFELVLAMGQPMLRGQAMVARQLRAAPGVRPGMALRFLELDDESRERLDRLCGPPPEAAQEWVVGLDLGATATRVALAPSGWTALVPQNGEPGQPLARGAAERFGEALALTRKAVGCLVRRAVVGVPAHLDEPGRLAVRQAADQAGLTVERLVDAPLAVALAYAHGRGLPRRRLVAFDLGGRAFGASVFEVEGDEVTVLATAGDDTLGGWEFDRRIAGLLAARALGEAREPLPADSVAEKRLRAVAEAAKVALSAAERVPVVLPELVLQIELTRGEFEAACGEPLERLAALALCVLASVKLTPRELDGALLVGGMAAMPSIQRRLARLLGKEPEVERDPRVGVAFGAALVGASLGPALARPDPEEAH